MDDVDLICYYVNLDILVIFVTLLVLEQSFAQSSVSVCMTLVIFVTQFSLVVRKGGICGHVSCQLLVVC